MGIQRSRKVQKKPPEAPAGPQGAQLEKLRQRRQTVAQLAFHKIQIFQQLPQLPLLAHCLPGYGEAKSAAAADDQNCTDPFVLHGSILSKRYVLRSLSSTTV